jgi:hypothetical protein
LSGDAVTFSASAIVPPASSVLCFQLSASCAQATVGAGLPVIATLKHLIDTGDKIVKARPLLMPLQMITLLCEATPALLGAAMGNAHT